MKNRNSSLDFLRFIALLLVLFRHIFIEGNSLPEKVAHFIQGGGWIGVDLFFVLSGFLVSGLIFKEYETYGTFSPGRFLIRRGFKIYPAFYLFLGLTWGMTVYFHYSSHEGNMKYLNEALFICNYTKLEPMHSWLWSICVEEHFYIFLCILMAILIKYKKMNFKTFLYIYLAFLLFGLSLRTYNTLHFGKYYFFRDVTRSHIRFDSLFFGVLLCYMYRQNSLVNWRSGLVTVLSLAIVTLPFIFSVDDNRYSNLNVIVFLSTNAVCFGYLMIQMLRVQVAWMRPFAYIGKYSYSIYLFHGFINDTCHKHFNGWKYYLSYFVVSLAVGIVISKLVEYPFLALRDRFFPSVSKSRQVPQSEVTPLATSLT